MKLQKLIIENIASIEKACIDFEHGPLGEDSIFLICGPTGAGKSTLLDAVCLALYNTTPRLKQAANERYLDESDSFSGTGEVSIDDSRMLMRRDSVSAQVELWFTDAAGDALRAVWSVARARNKAGGKIQKVVWTLSLQDGTPLTNKSTETRTEIERRIGLTFEQFCRTTLLAQGEFTKFLKSKEEEKSNILEKLTGTEIYSRISREIYVMKTEKEAELQELKAQTGGIVLLTDEELAALQAEQRQVTEETATLRTQLKQEQDLRKWMTDEQKLVHDLEETGKALQALTERVESEDYKRNKSLLDDWDRTADVRFQWTEQVALQQRIRTSEKELEQLKEKYRSLSASLGQLERMQVQCREQWAACETYLSSVQEKVPVYESLQSLSALSDQIQRALQQSEDYRKEKAHKAAIHQKTLEVRQGATASYEQAQKVAEEKQQEVAACRTQLEDLQVEELRQKKQEADARLDGWKKLREALSREALTVFQCVEKGETLIVFTPWQEAWKTDRENFITALKKETDRYVEQQTRREQLSHRVESLASQVEQVQSVRQAILSELPAWEQETAETIPDGPCPEGLSGQWNALNTSVLSVCHAIKTSQKLREEKRAGVEAFLVGHPEISREYLEKLAGLEVEKVNMARRTLQKLDNDLTSRRAEMERVGRELAQHRAQRPSETEGMTLAAVEETIFRLEEQQTGKLARLGAIAQMLAHHEECLRRIRKVKEQIEVKQKEVDNWAGVAALFGSADGKKFRNIAQSYVLRQLLAGANHYLSRLTDRYRMECPPGGLTILLRDEYQGGVKRPTSTISGGESFLVSLALALGLSSLNRKSLSVDVLFIDEGFGTLDSDYLNTVMEALEKLHQIGGKKVGIISHVEALRERIATQIHVERVNHTLSRVEVVNTMGNM